MKEEIFSGLADMLFELIHNTKNELFTNCFCKDEDIILSMPLFLIDILPMAIYYKHHCLCNTPQHGSLTMLEGLRVQPSHDLAITIFHKDYPLYKNPEMICRLPLDRVTQQYESYSKVLISLANYYKIPLVVNSN